MNGNNHRLPHPSQQQHHHQQLNNDLDSFNELTELNNADNFSLPATPIPRKKYYKKAATDLIRPKN
ncbi:hypothetical protein BLA29_005929 [Euroglyphus maynei]|uniref:Uncharacterized protein n=1 Tax=Euroglyphus maynei TaxID=6958 RepID=A0A1Y3AWH6_EURMA|nr:hypothetical protein BLA29_005929 [Euroglyphus maynei]